MFGLTVAVLVCGCQKQNEVDEAQKSKSPVELGLSDNLVIMNDVNLEEFRKRAPDAPVSTTAKHIYASIVRVIDGHHQFLRYDAERGAAIEVCGDLCTAVNRATGLPVLWPMPGELAYPGWFNPEPFGDGFEAYVTIDAEDYFADQGGMKVPCGYERATGKLWAYEANAKRVYWLDFSIQWYRTGCGG